MSNNNSSSNASRKKKRDVENPYGLIDSDSEVKSYIYQQVTDLNPYVTPETLIMVIARDPKEAANKIDKDENIQNIKELSKYKHRIAIILQEDGATLEAEAYHDNIFEAIKLAKTSLLDRLVEIQTELEKQTGSSEKNKSIPNGGQLH